MKIALIAHDGKKADMVGFVRDHLSLFQRGGIELIAIGITNNLIARMEICNANKLIEQQELGFVGKMSWGDDQTMSLEFYDQTNARYPGRGHIFLRLFSGRGFLGDIASLQVDLSAYGDLSGKKNIGILPDRCTHSATSVFRPQDLEELCKLGLMFPQVMNPTKKAPVNGAFLFSFNYLLISCAECFLRCVHPHSICAAGTLPEQSR
jgi:hypothetical protein